MEMFKLIHGDSGESIFLKEEHMKTIRGSLLKRNRKVYDMIDTFLNGIHVKK